MEQPTDAELIAASLTDPSCFGGIFDRHATTLHRYLVRRVGAVEADTLLGELFLISFDKRASFDTTRSSARPWLYGIATKLIGRSRRSEQRRLRAVGRLAARTSHADDFADQTSATIDAHDLWKRVVRHIEALPDGERDALVLHVWEELSYEQIATALDIPIGTVRSRLNRARRRIRELSGPNGEQPDNNRGSISP